jgi:hypothetical protein
MSPAARALRDTGIGSEPARAASGSLDPTFGSGGTVSLTAATFDSRLKRGRHHFQVKATNANGTGPTAGYRFTVVRNRKVR